MTETAFSQLWNLISGALSLNVEAFQQINALPGGLTVALGIVLLAGISEAIGQCIVLFINRVKPFRFILSLIISAVLFAFSFGFWVLSSWAIVNVFFLWEDISLIAFTSILGLSYTPQLFSFLEALPYVGVPIGVLLTIWSLLALVAGLEVPTGLDAWQLLLGTGLGWVVLQLLRRTLGRPIEAFGQWLASVVAGTTLITDRQALRDMVMAGSAAIPMTLNRGARELVKTTAANVQHSHKRHRWLWFGGIALVALIGVVLLHPGNRRLYEALGGIEKLTIDLLTTALFAILAAILLTPLEALQWWAGWYGDEPIDPGVLVKPTPTGMPVARYVTYLDGINQGSNEYLPEVNQFLDQLAQQLPNNVVVVKGIMPYSAINRPLTQNRPLAFFWRMLESIALKNPMNPVVLFINIRNVVAVTVSADQRYGPIQNQGLARVLLNSLLHYGYQPGSGIPISLIGYSGGGQMSMGAVPFLRRYLKNAPIEVISISGVISGNTGAMEAEHVYHLVGEKDIFEKLGPIMFPGRWALLFLSNWNCAKRRGKISFIPLEQVGHNGNHGPFGSLQLPDGRTLMQQTLDTVTGVLLKDWSLAHFNPNQPTVTSNYERYKQAPFNQISYYPLDQSVDLNLYAPIAPWIGRLILPTPEQRRSPRLVWFEVHHADAAHRHFVGQVVALSWSDAADAQEFVQRVTQDVHFVDQVDVSKQNGNIHPDRLSHWQKVDPLESLAGARPEDDVIVMLPDPVQVKKVDSQGSQSPHAAAILSISHEPVLITGRYYALVIIVQALGDDRFKVRHYNRASRQFDGAEENVLIPTVIPDRNGVFPSTNHQIEQSPVNPTGWYIYGAKNAEGMFVVQSIAPRKLFSLVPDQIIYGEHDSLHYINHDYWKDIVAHKGQVNTTLLLPTVSVPEDAPKAPKFPPQFPLSSHSSLTPPFKAGTRALLMHLYGGIGGEHPEFSPMGIFFGHFAYGVATIVPDPLSDELRFDIEYRQIYTHNPDGVIAGTNGWSCFTGDRQFGWLGSRPISEIIVQFPPLTEDYEFDGLTFSPLQEVIHELEVMAARYRIGDGTGTTFVTPVNSCVQDSSHALYTALRRIIGTVDLNPQITQWLREHPDHEQTHRFKQLADLLLSIDEALTPLGMVRPDWKDDKPILGMFPEEKPLKTLFKTLASWRSLVPRLTNDFIAMIFLQLGATLWVIRTNQVGGNDPTIEPIAPTDFTVFVPQIKRADKL